MEKETLISRILFSICLWYVGKRLRSLYRCTEDIREDVRETPMVVRFSLYDHSIVRWYGLGPDGVSTKKVAHRAPDVSVLFRDASVGAGLLFHKSGVRQVKAALKRDRLRIFGDESRMILFFQILSDYGSEDYEKRAGRRRNQPDLIWM